jgi:hypothetical protein
MPSLSPEQRHPELRELPQFRGLSFQPIFTVVETAPISGGNRRTMLKIVEAGRIVARDLPGRNRLLAADREESLIICNHIGRSPFTTTPRPIPNRCAPASRQILGRPLLARQRETNAKYPKHDPCLAGLPHAVY